MKYPNKEDVKGYRVQDKVLGINEYFPFSKYPDDALERAIARQEELTLKREIRAKRLDLPINRVFNKDGSVAGLRRAIRKRNGREIFAIQIRKRGKQYSTEVAITGRAFEDAYKLAQEKILALREVSSCAELDKMFKDCAYLYKKSLL